MLIVVLKKDFLMYILYLHLFLITVTVCGKFFQGKCGSSAEISYNIISIFLVKSLKKLLVRQKVFFGTLCYINMNFNHSLYVCQASLVLINWNAWPDLKYTKTRLLLSFDRLRVSHLKCQYLTYEFSWNFKMNFGLPENINTAEVCRSHPKQFN